MATIAEIQNYRVPGNRATASEPPDLIVPEGAASYPIALSDDVDSIFFESPVKTCLYLFTQKAQISGVRLRWDGGLTGCEVALMALINSVVSTLRTESLPTTINTEVTLTPVTPITFNPGDMIYLNVERVLGATALGTRNFALAFTLTVIP